MEDAPCSFVGDTALALNLLRGDAATSRTHEIHRVEPGLERSGGFFKNGSGQRINLSTTVVAAVGGAALDAVMLAFHTTLRAVSDASGPALLGQIIKARIISRKLFIEVPKSVAQFFGDALLGFHNGEMVSGALRVVKGYLPFPLMRQGKGCHAATEVL